MVVTKECLSDHRVARREKQTTSGIVEIWGEKEELLDDIGDG